MTSSYRYVAFDIETAGCRVAKHPIIAIGYVVGDESGNVLEKGCFKFDVEWYTVDPTNPLIVTDYKQFEPRCVKEFWNNPEHPNMHNIINKLKDGAKPVHEEMQRFCAWLNGLEKTYVGHRIKFLSDNPSFDIAFIDYNLDKYCDRNPLRFTIENRYRAIDCPDDMVSMLPGDRVTAALNMFMDASVVHDHYPSNDAHYIYSVFIIMKKLKQQIILSSA